jgi:deoxyribodipyrimidine photo-lyase
LQSVVRETGAKQLFWSRAYDPVSIARDTEIKGVMRDAGLEVRSFGGNLMFEPMAIQTKTGGRYKVFTPFWKAVRQLDVEAPLTEPTSIPTPDNWPKSDALADWRLSDAMGRGGSVVRPHIRLGATAALARLHDFAGDAIANYAEARDCPALDATSGLSENLTLGEVSPHQCWDAGRRAMAQGKTGGEVFLKELVWREFAHYLMVHNPHMLTQNWREGWDAFPWNEDETRSDVIAWKQGRTGIPIVDAGMREMYVTGRMHNRVRMIVASYLTKHLLTHWRVGQNWFAEHLTDWDIASNAMGWQWVAGSGPDASPFFRVFNPMTQQKKFDPKGIYLRRWIAEEETDPTETALSYFDAVPNRWGLHPSQPYPDPVVTMEQGRRVALDAYQNKGF